MPIVLSTLRLQSSHQDSQQSLKDDENIKILLASYNVPLYTDFYHLIQTFTNHWIVEQDFYFLMSADK